MPIANTKGSLPGFLHPRRLASGNRIGIAAPASHFDMASFKEGLTVLKEMGFEPVIPEGLYAKKRYLAGDDLHRATQINRYFQDDNIHAILCARGGYGSMRILCHLDFEVIRQHPKMVIGFSDDSALLWSLYQQSRLVTLHGPTVTTLAHADASTRNAFYTALTSDKPMVLKAPQPFVVKPGLASGPVAGGNLTTLCHLVGTPYAPVYRGHIVVLEDRGEAPYRMDRMLSQMRLAGCFDQMAGLVLGAFVDCGTPDDIYTLVADILGDLPIPILGGFEIGHGDRNLAVPLGVDATLDTQQGQLAYHGPVAL